MASTRFYGKPLADILGLPMIEHVRRRVALCRSFTNVVVATCDQEIFDVVRRCGGHAVMTSDKHERCTDRIAEAGRTITADIVVNVQGDEPMVRPEMFDALIEPLRQEPELKCANLMTVIEDAGDFNNPNVVKTVCDLNMNALYMSREPIPSHMKAGGQKYRKYKQLGIIAFRADFLQEFTSLRPTPLEIIESVDMMRAIEHGHRVRMVVCSIESYGVDTPEDLERVVSRMRADDLMSLYAGDSGGRL
jgi:3-deoxy-manno-octulosonate cytidylyltransferase (CMP-KDO synthetase)